MNNAYQYNLGNLLKLERRPIEVKADEQYTEIGIFSYGRGIFHKVPRTGLEVGDKDLFLIRAGDFIFQITFAWEGAVAFASSAEDGLYGSTRFPTFRVDEKICYPQFLLNYFKTPEGRNQLIKISPGSAGRNRVLSLKRITEILVPIPPLEEQQRIVARIEELAGRVEEARGLMKQIKEDCNLLCRSIFSDTSDGEPTLTPMRELVKLKESDIIVSPEELYWFAGIYSFGKGLFQGQRKRGAEFSYHRLSRLQKDNFVYPKLMAWEGAFAVVPSECDGLVVSPEFPVFEIDQQRVLPEILEVYFHIPSVWLAVSGASTGTNVRRRRLNPADFLAFEIPLPPMKTQKRLSKVKAKLDQVKQLQVATSAELDALLPSILDKAFKGEL